MDKIRLLAQSLDGIMNGNMNFGDFFTVHSGHFSPGTYLILYFEVKVISLNNDIFFSLSIPFMLYITIIVIWFCRLNKQTEINIKDIFFLLLYGLLSSAIVFSLYSWEIIWFSYGSIIFLSNLGFVLTAALAYRSFKSENHCLLLIIFSSIIGFLTAFLFGSGYSYAFLTAMEVLLVYYFVVKIKEKKKEAYYYLGNAILYLGLLIFFLVVLIGSGGSGSEFNLFEIFASYIYSLASLIISSELYNVPLPIHYVVGSFILVISFYAVFLYFKEGYFKRNLFVLFLFLFSELTFVSIAISRLSFGITSGDASRYYASYMFLSVFILDIFLTKIYEKNFKDKDLFQYTSIGAIGLFTISLLIFQIQFLNNENDKLPYRKEICETMVATSLLYDEVDDVYLENVYQADANNVRQCFDLLKEYELYTYDPNFNFNGLITDDVVSTKLTIGLYGAEGESRFMTKDGIFLVSFTQETDYSLSLYNPSSFKDNHYTIMVNNEILKENVPILSDGYCQEFIHCKKGVTKIRIILDFDTCPKEEGTSEDERRLGLLLS